MKIAMIGTSLFHQGAEYVLAMLAREMDKRGHNVTVVLSRTHNELQKKHPNWQPFDLGGRISVINLPSCRIRSSVLPLRRILVKNGFDVILDHTADLVLPLVLCRMLMRQRPKLIHVEHLWVGVNSEGDMVEPSKSFVGCLVNWLKRKLDAQFVVSNGTADAIVRMTGYPRDRIYTVYNPVLDDVFSQKLASDSSHPWLNKKTVPVVVSAGAFIPVKNHILLLRAWSRVVKKVNARLIIFGEGQLRDEYERVIGELGIGDSVSLPGFVNNLPAELKNASVFVVSSFVESFSVVIVEALACGVPIVSTDCPYGPKEILQGGEYGVLVKNNDIEALYNGILKVLHGEYIKPPYKSFAAFTADAVVDVYESAIKNVMIRRE